MKKNIRMLLPSIIILLAVVVYSKTSNKLNYIDVTESIKKIETTSPSDKPTELSAPNTKVKISTSYGEIIVELFDSKAPVSVDNFLNYVEAGEYDSTLFHRVIKNFMIQSGGFDKKLRKKKSKFPPILNEATVSQIRNKRGTLSMARASNPNSATNQFFINTKDNLSLDWDKARDNFGYAVFGTVIEGLNIVDSIENIKTKKVRNMNDVPVEKIFITKVEIIK